MARWELLTREEALKVWDQTLLKLDDYTSFQSYAWGEFRRALGWETLHWVAYNAKNEIVTMMLGFVRRYPLGFGLVWCEGGPVGDLTTCDESFQQAIKDTTGLKHVYIRFRCDRNRQVRDALALSAQGWLRVWSPLTSSFSMSLELSNSESEQLAGCSRKWRKNLSRASEFSLNVRRWNNPDADELLSVYSSMQKVKGLGEQQSRPELEHLLKAWKNDLVVYRCDDYTGKLLSISGWLFFGDRAWMWLSATSEEGRKLNASYAVFWGLVRHAAQRGAQVCDLCGIDPVQNHGVYRFKRDTGAEALEYLGEWDWATTSLLRWFGNWAIGRRDCLRTMEAKMNKPTVTMPARELVEPNATPKKVPQPRVA